MHDRFDEKPEKAEKDPLQQLEELTHHLNELYQQLSKDRDNWAVTGGDLAQTVEELQTKIEGFSTVEEKFKQQLASFIRQESTRAASKVGDALQQEIKPLLDRFRTVLHNTEQLLANYEWVGKKSSDLRMTFLTPFLAAATGGIIGALLIYFFLQRPR